MTTNRKKPGPAERARLKAQKEAAAAVKPLPAPVAEALANYKAAQDAETAAGNALAAAKKAHDDSVEALKAAKNKLTGEFWDMVNPPEMITVRKSCVPVSAGDLGGYIHEMGTCFPGFHGLIRRP